MVRNAVGNDLSGHCTTGCTGCFDSGAAARHG